MRTCHGDERDLDTWNDQWAEQPGEAEEETMTEHELESLRERRAEADADARERKAGHTAGPWEVEEDDPGEDLTIRGPEGEHLATVPGWYSFPCLDGENVGEDDFNRETLVNARLMAASPSLLEACARAHAALDAATSTLAGLDLSPGSRLDELCAELAAAREACEGALGRAEGEEG